MLFFSYNVFIIEVQAGPLEYSRVFFLERFKDWDVETLTILRDALIDFLDCCRNGIDKHESLCEVEHDNKFQQQLENGFTDTKTSMDSHWETFLSKTSKT